MDVLGVVNHPEVGQKPVCQNGSLPLPRMDVMIEAMLKA
jgi:hypothetical protein